jgi:hypothetical protein
MMRTSVDVQVTYGAQWLPGELILGSDGSLVATVAGKIDAFGPGEVFYIRSDGETDQILLDTAREAGFNVIDG